MSYTSHIGMVYSVALIEELEAELAAWRRREREVEWSIWQEEHDEQVREIGHSRRMLRKSWNPLDHLWLWRNKRWRV